MTPIRCGVDAWAQQDIRPGDVAAWPTNLGWMMGPWLLYAALLNGAAIALFQVGHTKANAAPLLTAFCNAIWLLAVPLFGFYKKALPNGL